MQSTTDPESGQQSQGWEAERVLLQRTPHRGQQAQCDRKRTCGSGKHQRRDADARNTLRGGEKTWEAAKYMGLDAGYHNAWIAHLLETKGIQGVIGYRRHTHKGAHYGKYRFRYDPVCDEYICPEKQRLTWKTTTREGYRQYCCEGKTCKGCPRRAECFGASMNRKVVERHVWQDALERVDAFTKTHRGKRIYGWRKETIERSFAEDQGEPRPALCAHAWDTEHAGTVFPDSSCAKYQEAGGLFLSHFSSLSIILPLRLCLNAGVCQWSEPLSVDGGFFAGLVRR